MSKTPAEIIKEQLGTFENELMLGEGDYTIRTDKIIAALAAAGYKIMPREPTKAMAREGWREDDHLNIYCAMWDAAP